MSHQYPSVRSRPPGRHPSGLMRAAALAALVLLAGCASMPPQPDDASLQREAMAGTHAPVPAPLPLDNDQTTTSNAAVLPQISRGSGQFVRPTALATPRPAVSGSNGVTFNFENQPVQAVVKAILGDLLKKNYTIVPGVQGNISFSTAEPVDANQALPILETLLSWTNNALVERGGSYVVLPAKDAVGGNLVPSLRATAPSGGLQARLFPLHYIAAAEMQKLIKPFARPDAVLLVDPARNVIVMSGTPEELANYQRTVRTFDVDWLRGMSVGVFNLQHADVEQLMPKLDEMFGSKGDTPLAGMVRFIPIKRTNALVVISTQPNYVDEVGGWIARIDQGGGNQPQTYVYDVRNIKASDLAKYLAQIYASNGGGGSGGGEVGPGLASGTLGSADNARGSASGMGSAAGSFGSSNTGGLGSISNGPGGIGGNGGGLGGNGLGNGLGGVSGGAVSSTTYGNANQASQDQQYVSQDGSIRIGSVDANNQLLVRARPSQWAEIEAAIKRLDTIPLQVQIETRILEVNLTGEFQFGVQWYLQGLTGSTSTTDANGNVTITPGQPYRHRQAALGGGGNTFGSEPLFYSFINSKMQVAVRAMENSGNTKTLSAPSLVVMNNQPAMIQVGNQVPVNQSYITPGLGTGGTTIGTLGQVQYLNTGVILQVVPRVNPGGLVYLDVKQQVSNPTTKDTNGNYTISDRSMQTQVAVQSGQTVLLGGLIQQNEGTTDTGVPGLNRVPILGRLFGTTSRNRDRTELIVLITPRVIRNSEEARQITDDYQQGFESLKPLRTETRAVAPAPAPASATQTAPLKH
ncbi:type II secretion system secretin GspD [Rhodanobacter sp. PCA2]|uniref:type II secretion system secretin GspD n=1 Tax=Rhodanobacter sp. PCA2 TaxID=2006117 RepID=UPI0015E7C304|nr:type II secretion system secretin GspD [Rhodanobacter sp. PCA2]MBA2079976.1 type II secretion system protein GspD [Rhodanobacter sp. PCA2]